MKHPVIDPDGNIVDQLDTWHEAASVANHLTRTTKRLHVVGRPS